MNETTPLRDIATTFYFPRQPKIRCQQTKQQYRWAFDNLDSALGRPATLADLTEDNMLAMMSLLQSRGLAAKTINERRGRINAMWAWLAKRGIAKTWPTTGPLPEPRRIPVAWTREQLNTLIDACFAERGVIGQIPAGMFWGTLNLVAWETSERIGALMRAAWSMLDTESGWLHLPAEIRKGGRDDRQYKITAETTNLLRVIRTADASLIWPWPYDPQYLWPRYKVILRRAGLPFDRRSMFHRIRKSTASHFDAAGGDATELLGHDSAATTKKSYIDPTIAEKPQASDVLFRPGKRAS